MIEIFSSDIEYVCKRMQETLDDQNGVLIGALTQVSDDFFEYMEIEKYKYDDGNPFVILSRRFFHVSGLFVFCVIIDADWYQNATESQLNLISNLTLKIKNREINMPIFMHSYTFDSKFIGTGSYTSNKYLNVNYNDCIINCAGDRYYMGNYNVFNDCIFNE